MRNIAAIFCSLRSFKTFDNKNLMRKFYPKWQWGIAFIAVLQSAFIFAQTPPVEPCEYVFISEFHYDNVGADVDEFIELGGTANKSLEGYIVYGYNGSNGTFYLTVTYLAGASLSDEGNGFGAFSVNVTNNGSSIQNGAPDGLALVDPDGNVLEFLSYEGSFTATDGPAAGLTSTDVGVAETSSTPIGSSIALSSFSCGNRGPWVVAEPPIITIAGTNNNAQIALSTGNKSPIAKLSQKADGEIIETFLYNSPIIIQPLVETRGNIIYPSPGTLAGGGVSITPASQCLPLTLSAVVTNEGCPYSFTGMIDLTVTGGSGNYTYNWSVTGDGCCLSTTTEDQQNIPMGDYRVVVSDGFCIDSMDIAVIAENEGGIFYGVPNDTIIECGPVPPPPGVGFEPCYQDKGIIGGGGGFNVQSMIRISEIHYDNFGSDVGEFVEISGPAGTDLDGMSLALYNGSNQTVYNTIELSGIIDNEFLGYGAVHFEFPSNGIQNGSPDGIALVDSLTVLEFLSYEGTITAVDGPAVGMTSVDIGVSEPGNIGESLQLTGVGCFDLSAFSWFGPLPESPGDLNVGHIITCNLDPDAGVVLIQDSIPGSCVNDYKIINTWVVVDFDGQAYSTMQMTTVIDTTPPVFTSFPTQAADIGCGDPLPDPEDLTAEDNCEGAVVTVSVDPFSADQCTAYPITYRYTATDSCGNSVDTTMTFMVLPDSIPPVFDATPSPLITLACSDPIPSPDQLTATDDCILSQPVLFFNEVGYDNTGTDMGEFFEIAGTSGQDLNGYTVVLYNGSNGTSYNTIDLSGTIPDEVGGSGAVDFQLPTNGLQNGSPDGLALVDPGMNVLYFISYEGAFTATNGPANGMMSVDMGVSEPSSDPLNQSLQLMGTGTDYPDFTWSAPSPESPGFINDQQTINVAAINVTILFDEIAHIHDCDNDTLFRTWIAQDACGNDTSFTQLVIILDDGDPVALCQDITIYLDENGQAMADPADVDAGSGDECDLVIFSLSQSVFSCGETGENSVTFTVTDACGNTASCLSTITVLDTIAPVFDCPEDITINLDAGECEVVYNYEVTATDNCPVPVTSNLFLDAFDVENWSTSITGDGGVDTGLAPDEISLTGANDGTFNAQTNFCIIIPEDGVINFDWVYTSANSAAGWDPFGVMVNGAFTLVTNGAPGTNTGSVNQMGSFDIAVSAGDEFCFSQRSFDGVFGSATTQISKFAFTVMSNMVPVVHTAGLPSGSFFGIGDHTITHTATDASGNMSTCTFTVTVAAYPTPIDDLVCNNGINFSLDPSCEGVITADMILEGGPYGCLDTYTVILEDENGNIVPNNLVNGNHVGQTLTATVVDPFSGLTCWGSITIEDKVPPVIACEDVTINCDTPSDPVAQLDTILSSISVQPNIITGDNPETHEIPIEVSGISNMAEIVDVNIAVDITHSWVGDLTLQLTSPSGMSITLVQNDCNGFGLQDINAVFDDEGDAIDCSLTPPTINGSVQPNEALNVFDGLPANGTWTFTFIDGFALDGGSINNIALEISHAVIAPPAPSVVEECGTTTATYTDEIEEFTCADDYIQIITRTWTVCDESGNCTTCEQTIHVRRASLLNLDFPNNYDGIDLDALECNGGWDTNGNNYPDPVETGEPYGSFCGTIVTGYEDSTIDICPGSYKVIRKWTIVDWCTGEVVEHTQLIKVADTAAPTVSCPPDMTVSANYDDCGASVILPAPTITDDCSGAGPYTVSSSQGDIFWNGTYYILTIPASVTCANPVIVTYSGEDGCGNVETCEMKITVRDDVPPVPVCDLNTTVSLSLGGNSAFPGYAEIHWSTFDDGSYDNCGIDRIQVRRNNACGINRAWRDYVPFCCDDIGSVVEVELGVWDNCNNFNSCFINVNIDEALPPTAAPPGHITISCSYPLDIWDLSAFGTVETDPNEIDSIYIDDPEYYDCIYGSNYNGPRPPKFWTTDGFASATCGVEVTETVNPSLECGQGTITRIFTATSASGKTKKVIQYITITDCNPFSFSDIDWPNDYASATCMQPSPDPDDLPTAYARPLYDNEDNCSLVSETYEDQLFVFTPDSAACWKVIRTWTVIDWCQYDPDNGQYEGYWQHTQVIKMLGTTPPVFDPCEDVVQCTEDVIACTGKAELIAPVTDDCTPVENLIVEYWIDLNNDGGAGIGGYDFSGSGFDATDYYEFGTHRILWRAEDLCGNSETCEYLFTVVDCKKPSPVCYNGLATVVMPSSGEITIWASDFDASSFDNCGDIILRLIKSEENPDLNVPPDDFEVFDCDDITGFGVPVQLWVGDAGYDWNGDGIISDDERNWDYCETYVIIQDPNDVCGTGSGIITGHVITENEDMIENAMVILDSDNPVIPTVQMTTESDGLFTFNTAVLPVGNSYELSSSRNDNHKNGVTTYDLVLMQKHILGIEPLNSNYKIIASDANADNKVTAIDIVEFRKLILGYYNELPNNTSWRFIDKSYDWSNGIWNSPETIELNNNTIGITPTNFIGMKVGDVNESAKANNILSIEDRVEGTLELVSKDLVVKDGDIIDVEITAQNFEDILGVQFSMQLVGLEYLGFEAGSLEVLDYNVGIAHLENNFLTFSWNSVEPERVNKEDVLFTLKFSAIEAGHLKDKIILSSEITPIEVFNAAKGVLDIDLSFQNSVHSNAEGFALLQNSPNPFDLSTTIGFKLPNDMEAAITVFDVTGKLLYTQAGSYLKGYNEISLLKNQLTSSGVLYYQIEAGEFIETKKMIIIE